MIDHVSISVADLSRAAAFYDAVMAALGHAAVWRTERAIGYGVRPSGPGEPSYLTVILSDRVVADRRHWAFRAQTPEDVQTFHRAALAHGGTDDGPPGPRPDYGEGYYAAFVRDPDGNRLEAVCRSAWF